VKLHDLLELAERNLRQSRLRNGLTTLGIGVGIASLVAMLSLGAGLQHFVSRRLSSSGLFDVIYVSSSRDMRNIGMGRRQSANLAQTRPLDDAALADLAKIPGVAEAYPDIRFATQITYGEKNTLTLVAGIPLSDRRKEIFEDINGNFFSSERADEILLQAEYAKDLSSDPASLIGKKVTLHYAQREDSKTPSDASGIAAFSVVPKERQLTVVGLVNREVDGIFGIARPRAMIPTQLAQSLHILQPTGVRVQAGDSSYSAVFVRVANPKQVESIEDQIKQLGFTARSLLDASRNLQAVFIILDAFLGIFGSLALVVASLGIVNTLVMAILERRHEIGIMKAIGASDGDVKQLFFTESGVMGVTGGVLGVLMGWGIGRLINFGTQKYLQMQQMPKVEDVWFVPWWLVLSAIAFSILVSLIAGLYPASRAAKLQPAQTLRYE